MQINHCQTDGNKEGGIMESFEITFFCDKQINPDSTNSSDVLKELYFEKVHLENQAVFETFDCEGNDFFEVRCSIFGLVLTEENFPAFINCIAGFVEKAFDAFDACAFATGIYELTYYYIENAHRISDLKNLLYKFPICFLREKTQADINGAHILLHTPDMLCVYRENAQQILSTTDYANQ